MKRRILTVTLILMGFFSYSQGYSISRNELIGKWYSRDEYKRINDSESTTRKFDIEFFKHHP